MDANHGGYMHELAVGVAGVTDGVNHRVMATAPDQSIRMEILRHRVPRLWDARAYAKADRAAFPGDMSVAGELRPVDSYDLLWCRWTLAETELPEDRRLLVANCTHAGLAHRVVATAISDARDQAISTLRGLVWHLPEGGFDVEVPEVAGRGSVHGWLWIGADEREIQTDDGRLLQDLVIGLLAARRGEDVRISWLDLDGPGEHLRLVGTDSHVGVQAFTTFGATPDRPLNEVMAAGCSWAGLAAGVALGLQRLLDQEDEAGYRADWLRTWFPVTDHEDLMAAVLADPPPLRLALPDTWSVESV